MSAVGLGDKDGVLVMRVAEGTESQKAGLQKSDVIRHINGQVIRGLKQFAAMWQKQPKRVNARLRIWRDQAELTVEIPTL